MRTSGHHLATLCLLQPPKTALENIELALTLPALALPTLALAAIALPTLALPALVLPTLALTSLCNFQGLINCLLAKFCTLH